MNQMHVNYLMDSKGNKLAVQIPFNEWSRLLDDYNRLKQYVELKGQLKESLDEIQAIEQGTQKASTLSEFLNEH